MSQIFQDTIRGRIDELKGLYSNLFVLIQRSLDREVRLPPDEQRALDGRIRGSMQDISGKSKDFRDFLDGEGDWRALCSDALRAEIDEFKLKLERAFEITLDHIGDRISEVETERDNVKERLEAIHQKNAARKGYPGKRNTPSTILSSEA